MLSTTQQIAFNCKNIALVCFVVLACMPMTRFAVADTCEGDKLALPDASALQSVQSSAMAGDTHAQAQMGIAYLLGKGVERNTANAIAWFEKSAAGGSSEGQYLLARYYGTYGKSDSDFQKAASLFKQSANQGCIPSLLELGLLTRQGNGVPKNAEDGFWMISKAADSGYPKAQMWKGVSLISGNGTKKDVKAGFSWVKRASDAGDSDAQIVLADLHLEGTGTQQNPQAARILFEKVYAKKDAQSPLAAFELGWMYMDGKGVPVDNVKAFGWMIYAAQAHVSDSEKRLQILLGKLPKKTLSTACSVYMDPSFATNGAKEYVRVGRGEMVVILLSQASSAVVYFPDRRLEGFIPRQCLNSDGK